MDKGELTDKRCRTAKPGRHTDTLVKGLQLYVTPAGTRTWVLRYQIDGRRRDMGLGRYPDVTLARAREKGAAARRLIVERIDPMDAPDWVPRLSSDKAGKLLAEVS